ncbi:PEP/pyruvate-binding domain-containing protein [Pseudodesulfovibrio sediminis]|uniref:Phosphoenolpyruvate synthase n=1 Tax=Pseudodesulfovibrio sediminis TaxID=2810563 RepID=A0ABN6EWN5_9BACT|nr:PEP/pyruvate-binding domain-containing protein [Pseudodesulfovibrio sediminis]BCS89947.1 phosphoenolpyruvate synthase [Pseudodesulfovibrio sediminis]
MSITDFTVQSGVEEAGGKGHNLKRLTSMGFHVPGGIVVGASFYHDNYPAPPAFDLNDESVLEEQCQAMRKRVMSLELPEGVEEKMALMLDSFSASTRFAVRSSSTFEDLSSAAFAGQHDTFLNTSREDVVEAVKKCFASLWSPHAVRYRTHNGFAQEDASMAVVIQEMLSPDSSGVVFSVDPVGGELKHVLIEGNFGVGESVVGGEAVTDSWLVDPAASSIVERRVNTKEHQIVLSDKGVVEQAIPKNLKDAPCLSDEEIQEIAATAKRIEQAYGSPQDIEWALVKGELFILQSRPLTKIPPRYTRDESAERFPEPLTPLTWSYVEEAFNQSLEHSLDLMGISLPTRPWFTRIDSYIYGNQNAVELLALNRPIDMRSFDRLREQVPLLRERFQWVVDLPNDWASDLDTFLMSVGRLGTIDFNSFTSTVQYHEYFQELFNASCEYFKPNIAISMTQSFLVRTLFEYLMLTTGDQLEAQGILKGLIADCGAKTGQVNKGIATLAGIARKEQSLLDLLGKGGETALSEINSHEEFNDRFQRFLSQYGHRETTFDYHVPTWGEAPHVVLDLVNVVATSGQEASDTREGELVERRVACIMQVMERTPEDLRPFADELIRLARQFSWLDDMEHFQTTRINPLVRKVIGAFGLHLGLENPYDLFFLSKPEIESIHSESMPEELLATIHERKELHLKAFETEPVWAIGVSDEMEIADEGVFKGVPGSPGTAEGEAYLVHGVEDFPHMPEGAILVAKTTNPSWTPLFYKCSALVTESGGPLSHGAVTARELGIPAVMFIRGALKKFRNGEQLRVDGQLGIVQRV